MMMRFEEPILLIGNGAPYNLNIAQQFSCPIIAADGGANHLEEVALPPTLIIGDCDSVKESVKAQYASKLHHISNQSTTDFEKILNKIDAPLYIGFGFLGGRSDHTIANINSLINFNEKRILLIGEDDFIMSLPPHLTFQSHHTLSFGLLPWPEAIVSLTGTRWTLSQDTLKFKGIMSNSNISEVGMIKAQLHEGDALLTLPLVFLKSVLKNLGFQNLSRTIV